MNLVPPLLSFYLLHSNAHSHLCFPSLDAILITAKVAARQEIRRANLGAWLQKPGQCEDCHRQSTHHAASGQIATNALLMNYAWNICRECFLDPSTLKNLDSNIKKNTAFIKKCKTGLTADVSTQLLNDIKKLSLEKYISEVVAAILEGLLRCKLSADVAAAIEVCFF